jgi:hypothetical protein
MKLNKGIHELRSVVKIIHRFIMQHHTTLTMMQGVYVRQPMSNELATGIETLITIRADGNFYRLTREDYINNTPESEENWLAAYSWYSNGVLIEIGGNRHCIFDTLSNTLYLETLTEQGKTTLELFIKNL